MGIAQRLQRRQQLLGIGPARWIGIAEGKGHARTRLDDEHGWHGEPPGRVAMLGREVASTILVQARTEDNSPCKAGGSKVTAIMRGEGLFICLSFSSTEIFKYYLVDTTFQFYVV